MPLKMQQGFARITIGLELYTTAKTVRETHVTVLEDDAISLT